jgi:glycopeptide antibiotics resistance protein
VSSRPTAKRTRRIQLILGISIAVWLVGVIAITIPRAPWADPHDGRTLHEIPFQELFVELREPDPAPWPVVVDMLANLLLLFPLGVLLPLRWPAWRNLGRLLASAALFSLAIESLQFVLAFGRSSSAADVVLNASGVALGYVVFALIRRLHPSWFIDSPDLA